jgi:hypothetical protein
MFISPLKNELRIIYIPLADVGMISMQFHGLHHLTHTFACKVHTFNHKPYIVAPAVKIV